jgi:hypothetical protein
VGKLLGESEADVRVHASSKVLQLPPRRVVFIAFKGFVTPPVPDCPYRIRSLGALQLSCTRWSIVASDTTPQHNRQRWRCDLWCNIRFYA